LERGPTEWVVLSDCTPYRAVIREAERVHWERPYPER
jgi:hypothetical protein